MLKCCFLHVKILGMIPYPEPYQSMYQQRRLGTLGIEWRPSSVRFAVGPDFTSDQDHILPLPDLDEFIDPLPEFVDAMEWEPEVEVISDDADSEFNVADSIGGDGEHISSTSSDDSECGEEDSDPECSHRDSVRRSRRRKKKREVLSSLISDFLTCLNGQCLNDTHIFSLILPLFTFPIAFSRLSHIHVFALTGF